MYEILVYMFKHKAENGRKSFREPVTFFREETLMCSEVLLILGPCKSESIVVLIVKCLLKRVLIWFGLKVLKMN